MIVYYITFLDVLGACHWVLPYLTFYVLIFKTEYKEVRIAVIDNTKCFMWFCLINNVIIKLQKKEKNRSAADIQISGYLLPSVL